jgi:hypothetical protein
MVKHWTQLPPGPNVGKTVKLIGDRSRKGKNRIREKGDMWKVVGETDTVSFSTPAHGPWLCLESLGPVKDTRWVAISDDPDFEVEFVDV